MSEPNIESYEATVSCPGCKAMETAECTVRNGVLDQVSGNPHVRLVSGQLIHHCGYRMQVWAVMPAIIQIAPASTSLSKEVHTYGTNRYITRAGILAGHAPVLRRVRKAAGTARPVANSQSQST